MDKNFFFILDLGWIMMNFWEPYENIQKPCPWSHYIHMKWCAIKAKLKKTHKLTQVEEKIQPIFLCTI